MTADRRDAIIRLLRGRDEHLPEPGRRTSEASAGFVHGKDAKGNQLRWLSCPDCLANDRTMFGCETCGGRGEIPDDGRDPYAKTDVLPFGFDGSQHDAAHQRDREIEVLKSQTRPASKIDELADANAHPYPWERARQRMYRAFDFAALDLVLEHLRVADDGASRALHAVYVYGWQPEPPPGLLHEACERGLDFLDERLPEKLRSPAAPKPLEVRGPLRPEAGPVVKNIRDTQMLQRADEGATPAELAVEFRVSIRTVYRVVNGMAV